MSTPVPTLPPDHPNHGIALGDTCRRCYGDGRLPASDEPCRACNGVGVLCDGCDDCRLGGCLCALEEHHTDNDRGARVPNDANIASAALLLWHEEHSLYLCDASPPVPSLLRAYRFARESLEREWLREALRRARGNRTEAAKLLGMDPRAFRRHLSKHSDVATAMPPMNLKGAQTL